MTNKTKRNSIIFAKQVWFLIARLGFAVIIFLTSLYCLLSYIPFTYHWLIKGELLVWLGVFAKYHPYIYFASFLMVATTLIKEVQRKRTRILTSCFLVFYTICGVLLVFRPLLLNIENNQRSLVWGLVTITPLIWLSTIDYISKRLRLQNQSQHQSDNLRLFPVVFCSAFVAVLYSVILVVQSTQVGDKVDYEEVALSTVWSFVTHFLMFSVSMTVLRIIRALSKNFTKATKAEFIICNGLFVLIVAAICRYFIFPRISFTDYIATLFSLVFAFTLVFFLSSLNIKTLRSRTINKSNGLEIAFNLVSPNQKSSITKRILWLFGISLFAYYVPTYFVTMDWDFLLQTLIVFLVWFLSFAFFVSLPPRKTNPALTPVRVFVLATLMSLGIYQTLGLAHHFENVSAASTELSDIMKRYAENNLSFQSARRLLSRPLEVIAPVETVYTGYDSTATSQNGRNNYFVDRSYANFYDTLKKNTNLAPSVKIDPVDIQLGEKTKHLGSEKPNIFIFVVDSLRQDYLSPYNKTLTLTPAIENFAKESVVFQNSFTRYGGTVLSEPAIWSGAMIPHKQYIEPFYPLNSLQKLLDTEGYDQMITMDPVLEIILRQSPAITHLDAQKPWTEYDLCQTVQELQTKIDARQSSDRPLFVYNQSQNLHLRRIEVFRKNRRESKTLDGLEVIYADEVKRFDQCFGQFVDYLKAKGIYDNSIIAITSDHGDSLGEEGRRGHSYWMFPEIVRIPLIIHLPSKVQKTHSFDINSVAFSLDLTPSLYYLLGYRNIPSNSLFGRPLFTETLKEHNNYVKDKYFLISSYGPVYSVVSNKGRNLFTSDAVNGENYYFDLGENGKFTSIRINPEERTEYENFINKQFEEINRFYNFSP